MSNPVYGVLVSPASSENQPPEALEGIMSRRDLKNHAYTVLREKLITCEFLPGSMLNEARLSIDLGVSRTPVREALNRIEQEGLVRIIPKKGIYVADVSLSDIIQVFEVRLSMEPVALRMAAPTLPPDELRQFREAFVRDDPDPRNSFRTDMAMHLFIISHCGNRFIIDMMRRVFDYNRRAVIYTKQDECRIHEAREEHLGLLDQILAGETDTAVETLRQHIECCQRAAMDFYMTRLHRVAPDTQYRDALAEATS